MSFEKHTITCPTGKSFQLGLDKTFITAEAGINHDGNMKLAKKLIDVAVEAGCSAVKFQKRDPHVHCKGREGNVCPSPWGTTLLEKYLGRELDPEQCAELINYSTTKGIMCFWSYWDIESLQALSKLRTPIIKIPSAKMTDLTFLDKANYYANIHKQAVFLGTGMCTAEQVTTAGKMFKNVAVVYMQCTSSYPCHPEDIHLDVMAGWQAQARKVGYSGHEMGYIPTIAAVARGAVVVERHITLDKTLPGTDHRISLEPAELKSMVAAIKEVELTRGNLVKEVLECEQPAIERLKG